jgi:DNA modification methylase
LTDWIVHHGDCQVVMAAMEQNSVDSIVTDPPYGLSTEPNAAEVLRHWLAGDDYKHRGNGFMGNSWDSFVPGPATWREAYRVLKPGGFLLAFFSTRTFDMGAMAVRLAGFEIRDMVEWLYGSGMPKGGSRDGRGVCLKPGHEPILLARKPFKGSVAENEAIWGTGALNIDACRIETDEDLNGGAYAENGGRDGLPGDTRSAAGQGMWQAGRTVGAPFVQPVGRWPANVIHDGSEEVVSQFPENAGAAAPASGPKQAGPSSSVAHNGFHGMGDRASAFHADTGSAARFFYCGKASKSDRDEGMEHFEPEKYIQYQTGNGESGEASSWSEDRNTEYRNTHPTVKPEGIMRWLVKLVTPVGGLVLDPFTGSGSTGKAAILESRRFVGIELTDEYVPIAQSRIIAAVKRAGGRYADAPPPRVKREPPNPAQGLLI